MNSFFSDLAEQFEMSFITNNRWLLYLKGLGSSLVITLGALALGVVLGILVAVVRTNHDQRKGRNLSERMEDRRSIFPGKGTEQYL